MSGEVLEEKILNIFGKIGCDISPDRIEACHRVGRLNDTVIVMFSKRKDCQRQEGFEETDSGGPGNSKLFINRSFCPYYKMLWSKSKKLHKPQ